MLRRFLSLLLVLSIAFPAQATSRYGDFHALVIGVEDYQHLTPLKTPIADAKAVGKLLKEQYGFTVEFVLNPDRDRLVEAIYKLRSTMTEEEDSLLIYYAGHGTLDKRTGVDYWQPVNAQRHSDLYWVPTSRVTDTLRAVGAKHVLVVADSCYSGSLLRDSGAKLAAGMSRDKFLQRMFQRRSRTALTSGGEEPVLDSGGSGHSVFAWVFLEILRKNKGFLEGDSLFDRIKRPVALKADQTPLYGDIRKAGQDVEQRDFVFVPKALQGQIEPPVVVQTEKRRRDIFAKRGKIPKNESIANNPSILQDNTQSSDGPMRPVISEYPEKTVKNKAVSVDVTTGQTHSNDMVRVQCTASSSDNTLNNPYRSSWVYTGDVVSVPLVFRSAGTQAIFCNTLDSYGATSALSQRTITVTSGHIYELGEHLLN
ncbi:MAG: caspase family protein [Candidatus Electrothrix sp. AR5]|nr:caspase family protein [Candidatus Electrothrix sp. AR5]